MILESLKVDWFRNTTLASNCYTKGPCQAHPDRGLNCQAAKGVSYYVNSGPLRGHWCAWGENADQLIFDRMLARLDTVWRSSLESYSDAAQAMRVVGK